MAPCLRQLVTDLTGIEEEVSDDLVTYRGEPLGDTYQGKEGFLEATADWVEGFAEWSVTPDEFIDAGDHVLVRLPQEGRGEIGGAPVIGVFWFVATLRDRDLGPTLNVLRDLVAFTAYGEPLARRRELKDGD
jgi:hypothetical protein